MEAPIGTWQEPPDAQGIVNRELLFYGGYPVGYHNVESEHKALAFQAAGMDVVYTTGVGLRDPRLSSLGKAGRLLSAKLARSGGQEAPASGALHEVPLVVSPPRAVRPMPALNARWLERQLRRSLRQPEEAVFWIRYPSPELVVALERLSPLVTVYECLDAMHESPGTVGRWRERFDTAERALAARADVVVVPQDGLAARFRAWGANVRVLPHGVDLFPSTHAPRPGREADAVLGFVGTLDYRLDLEILRTIALARPDWTLRLHGPLSEGFDRERLQDLDNVSVEGPVPYEELGATLSSFDAGILPYFDDPFYRGMSPVKNLELLAVGTPIVARPSPALEPFADFVRFASSPEAFVNELDAALATDSLEQVQARRRRAGEQTWTQHHATLVELVNRLAAANGAPP